MRLLTIDLVKNAAVIEMGLLGLLPSAKDRIDREQLNVREIRSGLRRRCKAGPEIVLRNDLLAGVRIEVFEIGLGHRAGAMTVYDFVNQRNRRFRQNTGRGINDLEFVLAEF